jgi:hypothetical protein
MGIKEFDGYSQAERDLTRRNFRKIITDTNLTLISWGLSLSAWEDHATHGMKQAFSGKPEALVFGMVVREFCAVAKHKSTPISFQFDLGRETEELKLVIDAAKKSSAIGDLFVNFSFSPVAGVTGLQAADLVAHESYRFFNERADNPEAEVNQHLKRLLEDSKGIRIGRFVSAISLQRINEHIKSGASPF